MKKKSDFFTSLKQILKSVSFIIPLLIIFYLNNNTYNYIKQIPEIYITITLSLIILIYIISLFQKKTKKEDILMLPSQNDYARKETSLVLGGIFFVSFTAYSIFIQLPSINIILLTTLILILYFQGSYLKKTAFFKKEKNKLLYQNDKEIRSFNTSNITELVIFKNQIILNYKNSEHLIAFLQFSEKDFKEIKQWFNKQFPTVSIRITLKNE